MYLIPIGLCIAYENSILLRNATAKENEKKKKLIGNIIGIEWNIYEFFFFFLS